MARPNCLNLLALFLSPALSVSINTTSSSTTTAAPQTILSYTFIAGTGTVWYDLSDVFGDALAGHGLVEAPATGSGCPSIVWANGTSPGGSQAKSCGSQYDVALTLCSS